MKDQHNIQDIQLLRKINKNIAERTLLQPFQRVLLAVSGGQDSICLMSILSHLQSRWQWQLGIVHCDHRWDPTSQLQAKHVARLAATMQIDYYQPIALQCVIQETIARNWRYETIQRIAIDHNYTAIVTAHNGSDRIETLIYHLIRGTGLQGIQSLSWKRQFNNIRYTPWKSWINTIPIHYRRGKYKQRANNIYYNKTSTHLELIRPLLDTTRTEIRTLLHYWHLPCWPDPTNQTVRMRRNRIRHRLIPYIRFHYNPRIDQALSRWSEIVHAENVYLERLSSSILAKIEMNSNIYTQGIYTSGISMELLRSLPIVFQRRILRKFIYKHIQKDLSFHYIEHIRLYILFRKSSLSSSLSLSPSPSPSPSPTPTPNKSNMKNPILLNSAYVYLPGKYKLFILENTLYISN